MSFDSSLNYTCSVVIMIILFLVTRDRESLVGGPR